MAGIPLSPFDVALFVLGMVGVICLMAIYAISNKLLRMKIAKEIGLWKRHRKYRPARPPKHYHIDEYGQPNSVTNTRVTRNDINSRGN